MFLELSCSDKVGSFFTGGIHYRGQTKIVKIRYLVTTKYYLLATRFTSFNAKVIRIAHLVT